MSLKEGFGRLRREIGIKKCIILTGNVGDVYLDNQSMVDMNAKVKSILQEMRYKNIVYWDSIDGVCTDKETFESLDIVYEDDFEEIDQEDIDEEDLCDYDDVDEDMLGSRLTSPQDIFDILFRNFPREDLNIAYVLNWVDYIFYSGDTPEDERNWITLLKKAIQDKEVDEYQPNNSTIILIANDIDMLPVSFYENNPDVSCITISKPDSMERKKVMRSISDSFDVKLPDGESFRDCTKLDEYADMLDGCTNREIMQLAMYSTKESLRGNRMEFDKVYKIFSGVYSRNHWERMDYDKIKNIEQCLSERVIGQEEAIRKVKNAVIKAYMGLAGAHKPSSSGAPRAVLFFVGPTGVGKTELSKALAEFLFGKEDSCIRFDMSEYADKTSDQNLIGSSAGYVGYEEGGLLTNAVKEKPFSVILFDEIEKVGEDNIRVWDIFLQILEDGRLTDNKGETVSFADSIIIFTSNIGSADVKFSKDKQAVSQQFVDIVKDYFDHELKRPELLGRIGISNIVPFNFIQDVKLEYKIVSTKLKPIIDNVYDKYTLKLEFLEEKELAKYIINGVDMSKGARAIMNAISDKILDPLALFLFENKSDLREYAQGRLTAKVRGNNIEFALVKD